MLLVEIERFIVVFCEVLILVFCWIVVILVKFWNVLFELFRLLFMLLFGLGVL